MYIQIDENIVCSKCNSANNYDIINRKTINGYETIIKCRSCNHEKIQQTLTFNSTGKQNLDYTTQKNKSF